MLPKWAGERVVCIASGPSLTAADCATVRARGARAVVTNTTFKACPWADALFGHDAPWWFHYINEVRASFSGGLFTTSIAGALRKLGVYCAQNDSRFRSFGLSGTDAVSFAIAAGAREVVLLGYDCQMTAGQSHHHGDHPAGLPNCSTMWAWPVRFTRLALYAKRQGVRVVNASRVTALECFERREFESCL